MAEKNAAAKAAALRQTKFSDSSSAQVTLHQHLQQLVAVDLANQRAGMVMIGNLSGIFGKDIPHDLVDRIVSLFFQCLVDCGHDLFDLLILFLADIELTCQIYHMDATFPRNSEMCL